MVENLKKLRQSAGVSQQQLADVIGISQQSINKYENHNIEPDIATLKALADYFSTSVDYLIGHTDVKIKIENISHINITTEEMQIIDGYRNANNNEKEIIKLVLKNTAG